VLRRRGSGYAHHKGADVSWLTRWRRPGIILQFRGIAWRVCSLCRALVLGVIRTPGVGEHGGRLEQYGRCDRSRAVRAHKLGLRIMIVFIIANRAGPGHQAKPAAWADYDLPTLVSTVVYYTKSVLAVYSGGVVPSWVQVGQ